MRRHVPVTTPMGRGRASRMMSMGVVVAPSVSWGRGAHLVRGLRSRAGLNIWLERRAVIHRGRTRGRIPSLRRRRKGHRHRCQWTSRARCLRSGVGWRSGHCTSVLRRLLDFFVATSPGAPAIVRCGRGRLGVASYRAPDLVLVLVGHTTATCGRASKGRIFRRHSGRFAKEGNINGRWSFPTSGK